MVAKGGRLARCACAGRSQPDIRGGNFSLGRPRGINTSTRLSQRREAEPFAGGKQQFDTVDYFVIRCEKEPLTPSDASERGNRDFARNSPIPGVPLLRDLIPLLFRCYSAVNSAVIPLLIPLLFPLHSAVSVANSTRKYLNQCMFSRRDSRKRTAESDFFPRQQGNLDFQQTWNLSTASRREARLSGAGHARKTRIILAAAMPVPGSIPGTGMTPHSVVFGRRRSNPLKIALLRPPFAVSKPPR